MYMYFVLNYFVICLVILKEYYLTFEENIYNKT